MKMGLERKLKQRIPEITEVIQILPNAPQVSNEAVETVLDGVRPFLSIAGGKLVVFDIRKVTELSTGTISVVSISGIGSLQPTISLKMEGTSAALQSVKLEIMQRIQRHFMMSLKIDWIQ